MHPKGIVVTRGRRPNLRRDANALAKVPTAPKWLSSAAKAEWRRVAPILVERKILSDGDLGTLESYCTACGTVREMESILQAEGRFIKTATGEPKRHPANMMQKDAQGIARQLAIELGLTPVARSRPAVRDDADDDGLLDV